MPVRKSVSLDKVRGNKEEESVDDKIDKLGDLLLRVKSTQDGVNKTVLRLGRSQGEILTAVRPPKSAIKPNDTA